MGGHGRALNSTPVQHLGQRVQWQCNLMVKITTGELTIEPRPALVIDFDQVLDLCDEVALSKDLG